MIQIAIDGPAGAGKSTVAKEVAKRLGIHYLDTGAMYRAMAVAVLEQGIDICEHEKVQQALEKIEISVVYTQKGQRVLANGLDLTDKIRTPQATKGSSDIAVIPAVRLALVAIQRDVAKRYDIIMDGRDIGTVVLPHAQVKVFLTASPEARAKRRCLELEQRGTPEPYEKVLEDIQRRDWNDTHRSAAPLRQAEDAVVLDTTTLDFAQSLAALLQIIKERV